jgi:hypothetical protein
MCMVSLVAQDWGTRRQEQVLPIVSYTLPVTQEQFDELKREVESLKRVLIAAKLYDHETGQPDCEDADKVALFRKLAEFLKIDLSEVFAAAKP